MTRLTGPGAHRLPCGRAFTIVEAVISTVIVSVMLVAALTTVGASRLIQQKVAMRNRGRLLAESLLAEIVQQAYDDPSDPAVFGPESGEQTGDRSDFDDVDDYHNWSQSPPEDKNGVAIPEADGWQRTVTVQWVDPLDPTQSKSGETKAKRITVTARHNNMSHATLVAIRAAHQ
ncbi:MAG: type II secretion system protein [Phycisphaerales bacterium]|nr:MAG: type II secretion system protein [Phycisphaerales bacterium]